MQKLFQFFCLLFATRGFAFGTVGERPDDIVELAHIAPSILQDVRYYSDENFYGMRIDGYRADKILCTRQAALALKQVQADLAKQGYQLVVYDAYRPQRAVNAFIRWSKQADNPTAKAKYYPTIEKKDAFKLNYIAKRSSHSRGSTFDLSILPLDQTLSSVVVEQRTLTDGSTIPFLNDNTLDMGSSFDLFHPVSHHGTPLISEQQTAHRNILKRAMQRRGFAPYPEEWWHYTLKDEPYPNTYFDFIIQ